MAQKKTWEDEYRNPKFMSCDLEPQKFMLRFYKYLKKADYEVKGKKVLDLGCGTGRNANYFARLGAKVEAIDIAEGALKLGRHQAVRENLDVNYTVGNIGARLNFSSQSFDIVIDATASNSLNEIEREIHLSEVARVLKPDGFFFVRALRLEGDNNAKKLLKLFPGKEKDTYIMPEVNLVERVFSEKDFRETYGEYFEIINFEKEDGYTSFGGQSYKRNFWIAYLKLRSRN